MTLKLLPISVQLMNDLMFETYCFMMSTSIEELHVHYIQAPLLIVLWFNHCCAFCQEKDELLIIMPTNNAIPPKQNVFSKS